MMLRTSDTLPIDAPDWVFVQHYAADIAKFPALLYGLKRPDGTLYLPKTAIKPLSKRYQKTARKAA